MKKKILILGNSAKEYALAKKLSEKHDVFVAPGNTLIKEFATCVDIRETSVSELVEFVLENDIDLTIPCSENSFKTNIVELFERNNLKIFAPSCDTVRIVLDKAYAKKVLYKLHIPTPKFGIFEKQNMANDYLKNQSTPFVIKTNEPSSAVILTDIKSSRNIVDSIYAQKNNKAIIEDYVYGTPFSFYTITDGYKALPIGSSIVYKHSLEGNGGQITDGMGACSPNYKLSLDNEAYLMNSVIYPTLNYLENGGYNYVGILGVNGILTDDNRMMILGYNSFMQNCDCAGILELIDTDLCDLIYSCVIGSFSDEFEYIPQKDFSATSLVLYCRNNMNSENVIQGLDSLDEDTMVTYYNNANKNKYMEIEANSGCVLALTSLSRTMKSSVEKVYNEAENLSFSGLRYRKDVGKPEFICV